MVGAEQAEREEHLGMGGLERILEHLEGVKPTPSGEYAALCPAHDDHEPSLSLREAEEGKVLLHCHAGCDYQDILEAVGLDTKDLFPPHVENVVLWRSSDWRLTATYEVKDPEGRLVALHERLEKGADEKKYRWRLSDGRYGLDGMPLASLPLYGSERVKNWPREALIVLVEGEKATEALLKVGFRALGTVTGASGTPSAESLKMLRGRRVVLWPDNDEAGREHMERVAETLVDMAAEVRIYTWEEARSYA